MTDEKNCNNHKSDIYPINGDDKKCANNDLKIDTPKAHKMLKYQSCHTIYLDDKFYNLNDKASAPVLELKNIINSVLKAGVLTQLVVEYCAEYISKCYNLYPGTLTCDFIRLLKWGDQVKFDGKIFYYFGGYTLYNSSILNVELPSQELYPFLKDFEIEMKRPTQKLCVNNFMTSQVFNSNWCDYIDTTGMIIQDLEVIESKFFTLGYGYIFKLVNSKKDDTWYVLVDDSRFAGFNLILQSSITLNGGPIGFKNRGPLVVEGLPSNRLLIMTDKTNFDAWIHQDQNAFYKKVRKPNIFKRFANSVANFFQKKPVKKPSKYPQIKIFNAQYPGLTAEQVTIKLREEHWNRVTRESFGDSIRNVENLQVIY